MSVSPVNLTWTCIGTGSVAPVTDRIGAIGVIGGWSRPFATRTAMTPMTPMWLSPRVLPLGGSEMRARIALHRRSPESLFGRRRRQ
jgi:hypothetical protein